MFVTAASLLRPDRGVGFGPERAGVIARRTRPESQGDRGETCVGLAIDALPAVRRDVPVRRIFVFRDSVAGISEQRRSLDCVRWAGGMGSEVFRHLLLESSYCRSHEHVPHEHIRLLLR